MCSKKLKNSHKHIIKGLWEASFIQVLFSIRLQLLPSLMSRDWKARGFLPQRCDF